MPKMFEAMRSLDKIQEALDSARGTLDRLMEEEYEDEPMPEKEKKSDKSPKSGRAALMIKILNKKRKGG